MCAASFFFHVGSCYCRHSLSVPEGGDPEQLYGGARKHDLYQRTRGTTKRVPKEKTSLHLCRLKWGSCLAFVCSVGIHAEPALRTPVDSIIMRRSGVARSPFLVGFRSAVSSAVYAKACRARCECNGTVNVFCCCKSRLKSKTERLLHAVCGRYAGIGRIIKSSAGSGAGI